MRKRAAILGDRLMPTEYCEKGPLDAIAKNLALLVEVLVDIRTLMRYIDSEKTEEDTHGS